MKTLILCLASCALVLVSPHANRAQIPKTHADLQQLAAEYYNWRNQNFPVFSSDAGLHTWDNRLTDYSLSAVLARRLHAKELLAKVQAMPTADWNKEDRIDWLIFRAQLENVVFFNRVIDSEQTDPQVYVNECSNGIFSLLKKRIRHTTQPRAFSNSALKTDAGVDRAGQTKPD